MNKPLTDIAFRTIGLKDAILRGLDEAGFTLCTPIQEKTLPIALTGKDVAGQAQTGTGKTCAFLVAAFQRLLTQLAKPDGEGPRALILAPTRELAIQIHKDALLLGKYTGLSFALAYGGTDYAKQLEAVKAGPDVLIGTPGRIIDYYKQQAFHLRNIQVVVLDEADRMFDLGFIRDIRYLLRRTPKPNQRLGLLFSATLSYRVTELAYEHMNNPQLIRIEPEQVASKTVAQSAYYPSNEQKIPLLIGLLRKFKPQRSIVFVNTKRAAELVNAYLNANGFESGVLSGDVPQPKRQQLLKRFQENELPLMIATDVAARGLHIPDVSHVFNFDLPQDVEDYVHRIGRTARLGAAGEAISFVCEEFVYSLPEIERFIGQKIPNYPITPELLPEIVTLEKKRHRQPQGAKPGGKPGRGRRTRLALDQTR